MLRVSFFLTCVFANDLAPSVLVIAMTWKLEYMIYLVSVKTSISLQQNMVFLRELGFGS
jgi:hypothetical protein